MSCWRGRRRPMAVDLTALSSDEQVELIKLLELDARAKARSPFVDTWDFLARAVWTKDEATGTIRQFPAALTHNGDLRFEYLHYLTNERVKHKIAAYDKSRRMMITWWLVAVYLYDIMSEFNHLNAIASDKLEKSCYLLGDDRMKFIYDHIPPCSSEVINAAKAQRMDVGPLLEQVWPDKPIVNFEQKQGMGWTVAHCRQTASSCMAVASGTSQMQQYTFTNVLMDEFPRWQWQQESWRNALPTTQGGGHVDMVCTPEPYTFADELLFDGAVR